MNEHSGNSEQLARPDAGSGGDALDVPFAWTWISQAGERHVTTYERHARDVAGADGCVVHAITPQMLAARQPVGVEDGRFPGGIQEAIDYVNTMGDAAGRLYAQAFGHEDDGSSTELELLQKVSGHLAASMLAPPAPAAVSDSTDITDEQIDARLNDLYRTLRDSGAHNGGMVGVAWDRAVYRMAAAPAAVPVDVLEELADALDCFWNPAVGAVQQASYQGPASGSDVVGAIAQGLAAVAERLRTKRPQPAAAAQLADIGRLIQAQDSRATAAPIFIVQQKRFYAADPQCDHDRMVWVSEEGEEAVGEDAERLEAEFDETGSERDGWRRVAEGHYWDFVTACFTEQGCKDYLARDGHNLREPRIYAAGSYRNKEWRDVRSFLASLSVDAEPPVQVQP
ncbi:hypothetical protein [Xanthomonas arboricola]|uniref:hypothetical protein n=1 Tax=Xanthomonas arboricola TaxID=56448 RepID=UPI000F8CBEC0|nr:hypothetical protein [Xanthomonas arboricola]